MDKKNTMLLTVIAVATLLVAVVGATFAFFSVTGQAQGETTVTANTGKIPTIQLTTDISTLGLKVTADDMQKDATASYYAIPSASLTQKGYEATQQNHEIATVSASNGDAGDQYKCGITVTVTKSGTMNSLLQSGDAKIYLDGLGISDAKTGVDLSTFGGDSKTFSGEVILDADGATEKLKADLEFNNTASDQSKLADKELTVTIKATFGECNLVTE